MIKTKQKRNNETAQDKVNFFSIFDPITSQEYKCTMKFKEN